MHSRGMHVGASKGQTETGGGGAVHTTPSNQKDTPIDDDDGRSASTSIIAICICSIGHRIQPISHHTCTLHPDRIYDISIEEKK